MGDTSKYKEEKQIALGILAHVDAGKTTLSESMLHKGGIVDNIGRVDKKNASIITNWKRSGASQSFPSRRCFGLEI